MPSKTGIANFALSHLGVDKEIGDLDNEQSEEAVVCRRFYDEVLEATLRDFAWPFATTLAALGLVADNPAETDEWRYSYRRPPDCLSVQRIPTGLRTDTRDTRIPYKFGRDSSGELIYTDQAEAKIEYTALVTDPVRYPADFVLAFSLRLAVYIAPRLTSGDPNKLGEKAEKRYVIEMSRAEGNAANEEQRDPEPESEFIRSRDGDDTFLPPGQGGGRPFGT